MTENNSMPPVPGPMGQPGAEGQPAQTTPMPAAQTAPVLFNDCDVNA